MNIATLSKTAQTAVYQAALAAAGVDARTVAMVEAHGPGTPVGDPIEYASLADVYGVEGPCALASVKTNFGHAQAASGALGMMKAILALQHGVVPGICISPGYPMTWPRSIRNSLCPLRLRRGLPTGTTHDGRRSRRTACREPTCTPSWNKHPNKS